MKRLLMLLVLVPLMALAGTEVVDGIEWTYRITDGKASIGDADRPYLAVSQLTAGAITIPSELGDCPVTEIGNRSFYNCSKLSSVTIPTSVTTIGSRSFDHCYGLVSMTIPSSVTSIGDYAFDCCWGLASVKISEGVETIGEGAFSDCEGLTSVTIPSTVTNIGRYALSAGTEGCMMEILVSEDNDSYRSIDGILYDKTGSVLIQYPAGRIGPVGVPMGVRMIGDAAFNCCCGVSSVMIPSSVTSIGDGAFAGCSLTAVTIPTSVTNIGEGAFSECGLQTVYVSAGDGSRVKAMLNASDSFLDVNALTFVEESVNPQPRPEPAPVVEIVEPVRAFVAPAQKAVMSGAVFAADGTIKGIVQVNIGKVSKKGSSKVTVTIFGINGKKMKSKAVPVSSSGGCCGMAATLQRATFNVKGYGPLTLDIGADGFIGMAGGETIASVKNRAAAGGATVAFSLTNGSALNGLLAQYLPDGVKVTRTAKKWTTPKAGKLKYVKPNAKKGVAGGLVATGENISKLKLSYKAKTGILKGTFKIWTFDEAKKKLKSVSAKVTGVVIDGVGYCEATVKKQKVGDLIVE